MTFDSIIRRPRVIDCSVGGVIIPSNVTLDGDVIIWVNAVTTNGGTVSPARKSNINDYVMGLKADGVWPKFDRLWFLAGEDQPSALTDLVARSLATTVGSPPYTANRGYSGDDVVSPVTRYIDSNYNASTDGINYTQNSAHISIWQNTDTVPTNAGATMGIDGGAGIGTQIYDPYLDFNDYFRINDSAGSGATGAPSSYKGHFVANRSGSAASQGYANGSLFASPNQSSTTLFNTNMFILCVNNSLGTPILGTPNQLALASIGGSLSSTDVSNFYQRTRILMTAVGIL